MILLTDNGSLEPAATLALRSLAAKVAARVGEAVCPVSLLHSSGIAPEKLGGMPAEILEPFLERQLAAGVSEFKVLPLFFGPSLAITDYLPKRLAALAEKYPTLNATVAPCLCDDLGGERLIAGILERNVRAALLAVGPALARGRDNAVPRCDADVAACPGAGASGVRGNCAPDSLTKSSRPRAGADPTKPAVILVDHGSPVRAVTDVRDRLAAELRVRLGDAVSGVLAASMERREGDEYSCNEPLLATALRTPGYDSGDVIVAMQFLLPGRHAGPGGDVARITEDAVKVEAAPSPLGRPESGEGAASTLRCRMTGLVAEDDALADLLAARVRL